MDPRVLLFPLSAQGHVTPMLKLAELFSLSGLHVSFLNTEAVHSRLLRHTGLQSRLTSLYPGLLFRTISDGLFEGQARSSTRGFMEMIRSMHETTKPLLKQMLVSGELGSVRCIVADGIFAELICDIGDELGIPVILFRTVSACCFWAYFAIQNLVQSGELPCRGNEDLDRQISGVPGMETLVRLRDLPSFCRSTNTEDQHLALVYRQTAQSTRAKGLIFNTFDHLEGPILSHIAANWPNIYTVGPLHHLLSVRRSEQTNLHPNESNNSVALFDVDSSCMAWLDSQPPGSVIYVSFGSVVVMTRDSLMEFWYGLVNSKKRFLWVVREDLLVGHGDEGCVPDELSEGTRERGFVAGWVPQEEVLSHRSVGGFLTHGGWNSTLESIVSGVPMICWPYFADQQVNSRYVGEVWNIGIDMKDVCDRRVIEKMIKLVMVERRDEFAESMAQMSHFATTSVTPGGSSYSNFHRLLQDIKSMISGISTV